MVCESPLIPESTSPRNASFTDIVQTPGKEIPVCQASKQCWNVPANHPTEKLCNVKTWFQPWHRNVVGLHLSIAEEDGIHVRLLSSGGSRVSLYSAVSPGSPQIIEVTNSSALIRGVLLTKFSMHTSGKVVDSLPLIKSCSHTLDWLM